MERLTEWIDDETAIPRVDLRKNGYNACAKKLAHIEDLEERLCEHYKANVTLSELMELFLEEIENNGEVTKGYRILTNRDAEEWDAYKQRIEELQKYRNIGTLEECLGYKIHGKGIDVDKVIEQLEENVENITDKNGVHHFAVPVSTATYIVKRGCLDEIAGKEKGEHK